MRIHCLENVDKALQFLRDQRVHLENMGSHDIVDGSARLTLGLIWTIILRFQVGFLFLSHHIITHSHLHHYLKKSYFCLINPCSLLVNYPQIQDITIEETDNHETRSAKDALLLW